MSATQAAKPASHAGRLTFHGRDARQDPPLGEPHIASNVLLTTLGHVFDRLHTARIPYCVLQSLDRISPALLSGSGVDIIVPHATPTSILVAAVADLSPGQMIQRHQSLTFYFPAGAHFLHVRLIHRDQAWLGASYLTNAEILRQSMVDGGIPIASRVHQAFSIWIHSLLNNVSVEDADARLILREAEICGSEFRSLLGSAFGPEIATELWQFVETSDLDSSLLLTRRIRRSVFRQGIRHRFGATLTRSLDHVRAELRLHVRPSGLTVAVLGPDGAGKSTLCHTLMAQPELSWPTSGIISHHLYRTALPSLYRLRRGQLKRVNTEPEVCADPHRNPPHGPVISVARLIYFLIDQWLSEVLWGRHQVAQNNVRLLDRHLSEVCVDPSRYRYGGPPAIARIFSRLVPQPDLTLLLDASPEVLQERKQEVSLEETTRQREAYLDVVRALDNGRVLNGEAGPEHVLSEAMHAILDVLRDQTRQSVSNSWAHGSKSGVLPAALHDHPSDGILERQRTNTLPSARHKDSVR